MTHVAVDKLVSGINEINQARDVTAGKGQILSNPVKLPARFNYALNHTLALLKPALDAMRETNKKTFADFNKAKDAIQKEFEALPPANREDKNVQVSYNERILKLQSETHKDKFEEWKTFMESETEVDIHKIKLAEVPDALSGDQMAAIFSLIEE